MTQHIDTKMRTTAKCELILENKGENSSLVISVARSCLIYMKENSETQNSMKSSEKEREIGKEQEI